MSERQRANHGHCAVGPGRGVEAASAPPGVAGFWPLRIVMIGGGYTSVFAYRSLRAQIRAGRVRVTVLSADDHHNFHGFTGEVVAGLLPYRLTRSPLTELMPLADVVHGTVVRVHRDSDTVVVRPADGGPDRIVGFDHLVVGAGGREPLDDIPGLAEHGWSLRAPGEFDRWLGRLGELTRPAGGRRPPVLIVGGGVAGVELAAAVADRLRRLRSEIPVLLVHSGNALLPGLRDAQPRLAAVAQRELARLGVVVRLGTRVHRIGANRVQLSDGSSLPVSAVLATNGQRPMDIPGLDTLMHDTRHRLTTRGDLSVTGNIWAAGDVACVAHPVTGRPVPADALWAIKAGTHLGRNLARLATGRSTRPFRYRGLGRAMSFGVGRAAAELYGLPICGPVGWLLRLAFFLRFMPRRRQALGVLAALGAGVARWVGRSTPRMSVRSPARRAVIGVRSQGILG